MEEHVATQNTEQEAPENTSKADNAMTLRYVIAVLAATGAGFMGYLSTLHYASHGSEAACDFGAELSCSVVNQSIYSDIFGIPLSFLGAAYFLTVAVLMLAKKVKDVYRWALLASVFSLVFGLYLSAVEYFILETVCLFCEGSKLLMLAIILVSVQGIKKGKEHIMTEWIVGAVLIGLLFSGVAWLVQKEPVYDVDYTAEAQCLTEKGVRMFGAYWCPQCKKQRRLFGESFQYIEEIECDPRGEGAQPELCVERDIAKTPTWIWEQNGEEVTRLTGTTSIDKLAEHFDCTQ